MLTLPLVPDVADPVRNKIEPLLPLDVVPVFMDKLPLVPLTPASLVKTVNAPLLLALP